jgi:hypothetical protein
LASPCRPHTAESEASSRPLDARHGLADIDRVKTVFQVVALALVLVVVGLVGLGFAFPSEWSVERSLLVNAEPETIHDVVSDLETWPDWADPPALARADFERSGAPLGAGSARKWRDARGVDGLTRLLEDDPRSGVWFESVLDGDVKASGSITFLVGAAGTKVTWHESGALPRPFGLYLRDGVERDVAAMFDHGLIRLKGICEARELSTSGQHTLR